MPIIGEKIGALEVGWQRFSWQTHLPNFYFRPSSSYWTNASYGYFLSKMYTPKVRVKFRGTQFRWLVYTYSNRTNINIKINGVVVATEVDCSYNNGTWTTVNMDDTTLVYESPSMAYADHEVEIWADKISGGSDVFMVNGFEIPDDGILQTIEDETQVLTGIDPSDSLLGTVDRQVIHGHEATSSLAAKSLEDNVQAGYLDVPQVGYRVYNYAVHRPTIYSGTTVPTAALDPNRKYQILFEYKTGQRQQWHAGEDWYLSNISHGVDELRVHTGVSIFGIGFERKIVEKEDKQIRRWPREWHGENM